MTIRERLFENQDKEYAAFQAKLTPTITPQSCIGVRVPVARELAKEIYRQNAYADFLNELPHVYYDENMLHGLIVSQIKEYETCIRETDRFLPYVDNWAVCDIMSPKVFGKNRDKLIGKIEDWSASAHTYTCRFGLGMLMTHYLDGDFREEYLRIPASVRSQEYYVNMMIAWFFATALSKQWEAAFPYIREQRLDAWVNNKTIQKARESYRITPEQKQLLNGFKRH